ncbi:hypothetical protein [Skermanella pratensis]|uniref:hypothetical protein n=1 Tax=Skermanella pratensis TaxID=2233999 RepID=UPI001300E548|nr:hypothetical protein [Skermanella pratensis]
MSDHRAFRGPYQDPASNGSPQATGAFPSIPELRGFESARPLQDFGADCPIIPAGRLTRRLLDAVF